jgi:hypothetical protein
MSDQRKWTAGPWLAEWVVDGQSTRAINAPVGDIAFLVWRESDDQLRANASVMAAAPDLYEALYELLAEIAATEASTGVSIYSCDRARSALSKAEGRA